MRPLLLLITSTLAVLTTSSNGLAQQIASFAFPNQATAEETFCLVSAYDDSRIAASCSLGIVVWDTSSGEAILHLPVPCGYVRRDRRPIAISSDGKLLAYVHNKATVVVEIDTKKEILREELEDVRYDRGLAFSPDGQLVAIGEENGRVTILDVKTGKPKSQFQVFGPPKNYDEYLYTLDFLIDGKHLAVGGYTNGRSPVHLLVINTDDGSIVIQSVFQREEVTQVRVASDGTFFSKSDDDTVKRLQFQSGKLSQIKSFSTREGISVSRNGQRLLLRGTSELIDTATSKIVIPRLFGLPSEQPVLLSCEGTQLVVPTPNGLDIWALEPYEKTTPALRTVDGEGRYFGLAGFISGENSPVLLGRGGPHNRDLVLLYDKNFVKPVRSLEQSHKDAQGRYVSVLKALGVGKNGFVLLEGKLAGSSTLFSWSASTGALTPFLTLGANSGFSTATCSEDGEIVLVGFRDRLLAIDSETRKPILDKAFDDSPGLSPGFDRFQLSPDHKWLAADCSDGFRLYDFSNGEELFKLEINSPFGISADSRYCFGLYINSYVGLWRLDLNSGVIDFPLSAFRVKAPELAALDPARSIIATFTEEDQIVQLWDLRDASLLANLTGINPEEGVEHLKFDSQHGRLIAVEDSAHGNIVCWDILPFYRPNVSLASDTDTEQESLVPDNLIRFPKSVSTSGGVTVTITPREPITPEQLDAALDEARKLLK